VGHATARRWSLSHGEVQLARVATVEAVFAGCDSLFGFALRTGNTVFPEPSLKILASGRFIGKQFKEFESADS